MDDQVQDNRATVTTTLMSMFSTRMYRNAPQADGGILPGCDTERRKSLQLGALELNSRRKWNQVQTGELGMAVQETSLITIEPLTSSMRILALNPILYGM